MGQLLCSEISLNISGIPRIKDNCRAVNDLKINAIKCSGTSYKMLSIESLDWDTMSRRLSPVAFSQVVAGDKYIDLLNGPQDHGCCAGYSCHRRLSLFKAIVAVGKKFENNYIIELNDLRKIVCLRKFAILVERISVCIVIENLAEHGIHCMPCSNLIDVIDMLL